MLDVENGVLQGFLAVVAEQPDRIALTGHGQRLSYAELAEQVAAVARRLGSRPGVVAVPVTHAPPTIATLLGVWAAGGAYCPIDPTFPAPRRHAMQAAAGCGPGEVEDLAYVLFTSGSTGTPRPVLTPQRAIAATVASLRGLFGLTPADRVLQFASLNWDTCFEEILPTLTSGACLVFDDDAYAGSFPRFLRMVARERITVLDLPTAYWHELVNFLVEHDAALPECLRLVIIGGEAANPTRLAQWQARSTAHARLLNTYGCTETTLITHAIDLAVTPPGDGPFDGPVPIGRALPHVIEHITDEGELLIGGPAVADGYRGLPEATAARFVTIGPTRYFRTGDRVSRRPDGALIHKGRIDGQLKIRGVRVDPSEVEAHIAGHAGVRAVAVVGVAVADHTVLVAYVVPGPRTEPADLEASIVAYLRGRVPGHLIPSRIRVVPDLVYTASGKVDRHQILEVHA